VGGDTSNKSRPAHAPLPCPFGTFTGETAVNAHPARALTLKDAVSGPLRPLRLTETVPDCTAVPDQVLLPEDEVTVTFPVVLSVKVQLEMVLPP